MTGKLPALIATCALAVAAAADPLAEIRELYAEINAVDLTAESLTYQDDDGPRSGDIRLLREEGKALRKARAEILLGDHSWRSVEVYFDDDRKVRFVFAREGSWQFDPAAGSDEGTLDSFDEMRFYFDETGTLLSALNKSYSVREKSEERAAADAAPNREIEIGTMAARRIREAAAGFKSVNSPAAARATEDALADAIKLRDESDPPPAGEAWIPLDWPEETRFAGTFGVAGVAFEMLGHAGIATRGAEAPGVVASAILDPDADPPSSVLITLDRLADDSVRGERYRIDLTFGEDQVWRPVFFGKQVRCYEGRGHQDWSKSPCQ